ncbi:hypothetical protein K505DRAFT_337233 [Melanomma pulvis-pyrius CBS 109.77]|uniref:Uncharacterized protein n=1 Tax=Melanomma pulvis-pyrius CBS 109.77 TaxID=1314802 RepID=A0A6A6XCQ6_9PLEO|nr:hypothetical protein K505DRAFT_337233 [Melanomma pulvis-pyrius CBS 109.77]
MILPVKIFLLFLLGLPMWRNVWAVYGVMVDVESSCVHCTDTEAPSAFEAPPSPAFTSPPSAEASITKSSPLRLDSVVSPPPSAIAYTTMYNSTALYPTATSPPFSPALPTTSAPPGRQTQGLSREAKTGIGVSVGILAFACVFLSLLEVCYLRRKRRERAMQNAVEEVERGTGKGSEERIVLESRVSIVFEEEAGESESEDEDEGARNGMSLPRRE